MMIGYTRVSTQDQNPNLQAEALAPGAKKSMKIKSAAYGLNVPD